MYTIFPHLLTMTELTSNQRDELIEQFVELVVDNMDTKTLVQYVTDDLTDCYNKCSDLELKEYVDNYDDELFNELVDNVTMEDEAAKYQHLAEIKYDREVHL